MTSIEHMRAAPPKHDRWLVLKATLMSGVSGFAFGLWRNGLPDSPWMLAAAAVAAVFATYWLIAVIRTRKISMRDTAATVRAMVSALPPWPRLLALPPPARPTEPKSKATKKAKPAAAKRAVESQATLNPDQRRSSEDERARPKAPGDNDEVSDLLARQTLGAGAAKGGFGTGTAAGAFLNNLDAVLAYARHLIPSFKSDLQRMFDEEAEKADRVAGALSFSLKCGGLGVLAYFLYIESIEFKARAYKTWAEACIARQQNGINHATLNELGSGKKLDGDDDCASK